MFETFLCCFSLPCGGFTIGIIGLLYYSVTLILSSLNLADKIEIFPVENDAFLIYLIVESCFGIFFYLLVIIGTKLQHHGVLFPYLIAAVIDFLATIPYRIAIASTETLTTGVLVYAILDIVIGAACRIYFWCIIYSLFLFFKNNILPNSHIEYPPTNPPRSSIENYGAKL